MKTLEMIRDRQLTIPMTISWLIADIGRSLGTQEMFIHQSPQRLKLLREHSMVQSVISSNRIEGVEIDQSRVGTVIFGQPLLKDRGEEDGGFGEDLGTGEFGVPASALGRGRTGVSVFGTRFHEPGFLLKNMCNWRSRHENMFGLVGCFFICTLLSG